ncbi:MAG: hypothetical protein K2V38_26680, partial [Gemmataceae bacterium]|nr:hypothetical protein [Gemmataceae bacterium]
LDELGDLLEAQHANPFRVRAYHNAAGARSNHSMTAAGLLALAVSARHDPLAKGPGEAFEKGMAALLEESVGRFGTGVSAACSWMTVAELGRTLDVGEFKSGKLSRVWYREAAERFMKQQREDGSWKSGENGLDGGYPAVTTACGLYLLGPPAPKK